MHENVNCMIRTLHQKYIQIIMLSVCIGNHKHSSPSWELIAVPSNTMIKLCTRQSHASIVLMHDIVQLFENMIVWLPISHVVLIHFGSSQTLTSIVISYVTYNSSLNNPLRKISYRLLYATIANRLTPESLVENEL